MDALGALFGEGGVGDGDGGGSKRHEGKRFRRGGGVRGDGGDVATSILGNGHLRRTMCARW